MELPEGVTPHGPRQDEWVDWAQVEIAHNEERIKELEEENTLLKNELGVYIHDVEEWLRVEKAEKRGG